MGSIAEGLRVLKPGGELQLQPWLGSPREPWPTQWRKTATDLYTNLRGKGIKYTVERGSELTSPLLKIVK